MTTSEYIAELQSYEEYSFSWEELVSKSNKSKTSLRRELSRLTQKKEIINLRRGFYLIIPPRYSHQQKIPLQLYVDKLFIYLQRPYYLGFYTAAKFFGASHQQIQRDYVVSNPPAILDIKKGTIDLRFFAISNWPGNNILKRKSDAGFFHLSSPALTAVDLIHHQNKIGGMNRVLAVLEELMDEIEEKDITNLLDWYPHRSTLQRFGYLLDEELSITVSFSDLIYEAIAKKPLFPVLLSPDSEQKAGAVNNRWKVDVNITIEGDL